MNIEMDNFDNQSIISDITDCADNNTVSSTEVLLQKLKDTHIKTETELNKLTSDDLKEKCRENNVAGFSKLKKPELIQLLLGEFLKLNLLDFLKDKKMNELKSICKANDIKGFTGLNKDELKILIYNETIPNFKFKIDDNITLSLPTIVEETKQIDVKVEHYLEQRRKAEKSTKELEKAKLENLNTTTRPEETKKLTPMEELEKQRLEIETKMKKELDKQKRMEEEELKKKKLEEQKLAEEEKKKEKEEAKKKKQSIPKQVRVIVWNHYIGEDIIKHKCLCCKKVTISNTNFDVGHVLSEKNGGTHEINNLRPICGACNHSMGSENMIDFVVKYGLFIG